MSTLTTQALKHSRLHGLDYLRGIAALGIMVYHYSSWTIGEQPASSVLGRIGIYGVAIFYILSGQALSFNYNNQLNPTISSLKNFYKKRAYRIFPLFWAVTIASVILSKQKPALTDLFLNFSGLFGLVRWDTYFATGAWSIGNELSFYLAFPIILFLIRRNRISTYLISFAILATFAYVSFFVLKPVNTLSAQWRIYTCPLNNLLFFFGGVLIGIKINPTTITNAKSIILGMLGVVALFLWPVNGNAINLVTGINRLVFSGGCFLLCLCFFRDTRISAFYDVPFAMLGRASYSLYLIHPLVYNVTKACFLLLFIQTQSISIVPYIAGVISLVSSYFSYQYFEKHFINLSRNRQQNSAM